MFKFMAGLMFALWAGVCWADDKPQIGPAPGWAKPIDAPIPPASADMSAPVRRLLTDVQVKFDERGDERYTHTAFKMQTPAGLAAGNVVLAWNPDTDRLTIHQVRIIRGAEVIDLLARGQKFTVLRRETNLERAMLDGVLTASLQPEGLQVGDILDVAYTVRHSDPVMKGNSESLLALLAGPPTDHLRIREFWRADRPALWKQTGGFKEPTLVTTANVTELVADEHEVAKPIPPKGAPARYLMGGMLETSQFRDWSEVSALMSPLYVKAASLTPDSPLQAEVARIRQLSSDPKLRAAAALHLVQDKVRYLFLGMNAGGYVPADAEVTWSRRFGDCKGKTALLLALLHGLDIDAEPAMVSTAAGDGLDGRLPMVEWFDHILVRAQIAGHTYWLDGMRAGDRSLDEVRVPAFAWALPVQPTGAKLERLVEPPYDTPVIETRVQLDASGGLAALAPAHLEIIYRGDLGSLMHVGLAAVPPAEMQDKLKEVWSGQYRWIEIKSVDAAYDPQTGEQRLTMDGEASMAWNTDTDSGEHKYETDGSALTLGLDFKRDPGPGDDAPFALDYPLYARSTETIILPQGGKGFSVSGDDVDKTVAAHAFKRTTRIDKGVLHMEASIQALAKELPAADAPAAKIGLRDVSGATVYLIAPKTYSLSDAELAVRLKRTPTLASEYGDRGDAFIWSHQYEKGIADLDRVVAMKPGDADALNARCFSRALVGKDLDKALADCNAALDIDPKNAMILDSRGFVYFRMGQDDKAMADLKAALKIQPQQATSLYVKGLIELHAHNQAKADTDFAMAKALQPTVADTYQRFGVN